MAGSELANDAGRLSPGSLRTFGLGRTLPDPAESPATLACLKPTGTGLAGVSRGLSRPTPIVIWSSKIAKLEPRY